MLEKEFQSQVIQFAQLHGWRTAHFRPALTRSGKWMTAVQGDGAGFPDLVLVRKGKIMFVELKQDHEKPNKNQRAWLEALAECGVDVEVWRPRDWCEIEEVLR
jgi:hypothetical protein